MRCYYPQSIIRTEISEGGLEELKHIELIGRACYKSEDKITEDGESAKKFITQLIKSGHESVLEHSTLCITFICDRGISHELVRHRLASFTQESTRYCNYANDKFDGRVGFIPIEEGIKFDSKMNKLGADFINLILDEWYAAMSDAEKHYLKMIELGASPQIARSVLPNSTKTEITITANYREWRHFFKLRLAKSAHPQMRELLIPLFNELKTALPVIFDDIQAEDRED